MIVVGTGCFFSLIFHLGTKEPPQAVVENNKGKTKHLTKIINDSSSRNRNLLD